eukprot:8879366-Alexandrium_andersonii.AAC.1
MLWLSEHAGELLTTRSVGRGGRTPSRAASESSAARAATIPASLPTTARARRNPSVVLMRRGRA